MLKGVKRNEIQRGQASGDWMGFLGSRVHERTTGTWRMDENGSYVANVQWQPVQT
jgi:hypothetical protein